MDKVKLNSIAKNIVNYSLKIKEGQKLFIRTYLSCKPLVKEIIKETKKVKAFPYIEIIDDELKKDQIKDSPIEMWELKAKWEKQIYDDCDALCVIRPRNDIELSEAGNSISNWSKPIMEARRTYINEKEWVLLTYPTDLMSFSFNMSKDKFEEFWLDVCSVDYSKMNKNALPLKKLMDKTDKVRIVGVDTDISFSIKGIDSVICAGQRNIPDGEVFTAPVKNSVNGYITYNIKSPQGGVFHENVKLEVKDGYITKYSSNNTDALDKIFSIDEGARHFGEFAIGINNSITKGVGNILFDEKMKGSIHLTPGNAYENEADNGNRSALHWDLVYSQQLRHGGGEIYFDNVLVRKDGLFVLDELLKLNN